MFTKKLLTTPLVLLHHLHRLCTTRVLLSNKHSEKNTLTPTPNPAVHQATHHAAANTSVRVDNSVRPLMPPQSATWDPVKTCAAAECSSRMGAQNQQLFNVTPSNQGTEHT